MRLAIMIGIQREGTLGTWQSRTTWERFASVTCLAGVVTAVMALDDRVKDRVVHGLDRGVSGGVTGIGAMAATVGDAVTLAARNHTIEHAPLLLFIVLGAVLVFLMIRT
jgi:hypothetical protein